ncbi:MAG: GDP-L-fucose synthase [Candidatus Omnitrophica bacterium]|nr:GDP-L-fucose synthase [Candidatus Omnitrophota bacterium]
MPIEARYIAGHTGLLGQALLRAWEGRPDLRLVTATRQELDLTDARAVERFLAAARPDTVILAAGRVGGIAANQAQPAQFIHDNLMIEANLIHGAWKAGVARLLNFGSGCMYPTACPQPMRPEQLMTGPVEPTSEPYAMAKLAGLSLCAAYNRQYGTRFISAIPCTLYGPGDHFEGPDAHVLSALIAKFHEAKAARRPSVTLWGSGNARREFLHVDDMASACETLLSRAEGAEPINVGSGTSQTIRELAELIRGVVGYEGGIGWDASRPDGAPDKRLDSSAIRALGWAPRTELREGIERTYAWFREHQARRSSEVACVSS